MSHLYNRKTNKRKKMGSRASSINVKGGNFQREGVEISAEKSIVKAFNNN